MATHPHYKVRSVETGYWRPNHDYINEIRRIGGSIKNGDLIVVSEKAISIARGLIFDESGLKPNLLSKFLSKIWMRIVWGVFLARICNLSAENIERLRRYPKEGDRHKFFVLRYAGFFQALKPFSEGGVDANNLPHSFVSLPLNDAVKVAEEIRIAVRKLLSKEVGVMVVDTDRTFSFRNLHFATRNSFVKGIYSINGFLTYTIGKALGLKPRATPIAIAGSNLSVEEAIRMAEIADNSFNGGAGPTVWDMAKKFGVGLQEVTWEMLESIRHMPIAIIRRDR